MKPQAGKSSVWGILAALVVFATLSGLGPAFASAEGVVLCKINEEFCRGKNSLGYTFTATAETTFDFGESGIVACASTMTRNEEERITALSFSSCTKKCSITANKLPYWAQFQSPKEGNGTISMFVYLTTKCGTAECPYSGWVSSQVVKGGEPVEIQIAKSLAEEGESIFCPDAVTWEGKYQMTSPSGKAFVVQHAIEGPVFCIVAESPCPQTSIHTRTELEVSAATEVTVGTFPGGSSISCARGGFQVKTNEPFVSNPKWMFKPYGFWECSSPIYSECYIYWDNPPYPAILELWGGGSGAISVVEGEVWEEWNIPTLAVSCVSKGTPFTCEYTTPEFVLEFEGGAPSRLYMNVPSTRKSGSLIYCSTNVTLEGELEPTGWEEESLYLEEG